MQFAGARVAMRMSGIAAGQGSVEVAGADGVEFVGEFVVGHAAFDERQRLAGVGQHVGVGAQGLHSGSQVACGGRRLAERGAHTRAADPAVAVPAGLAVLQRYAVHHAVAGEPVIGGGVDLGDGVGPVAQVTPVEEVGDVPGDRQIGRGDLGADRRQEVIEIRVRWCGGDGCAHFGLLARITLIFHCYTDPTAAMSRCQR